MKYLPTKNLRHATKSDLIEHCGQCSGKVALVRPSAQLDASPWRCRGCGALFLASPERRGGSLFRGGLLRASFSDVFPPANVLAHERRAELSAHDLDQLKRCMPTEHASVREVRLTERYPVVTSVSVLAVEEDFRVSGKVATAYTIDVSCGGLSILHPEPTTAPYFAVDFALSSLRIPSVIFRPMRCSRLGSAYAVAGEFVCRLEC